MNEWFLGYLLLGAVAGFFAGLLGVGGGAIMVPVLALMFAAQGFPEAHLMHLALGTSMATIVFTSISSLRAHHQHGAVHLAHRARHRARHRRRHAGRRRRWQRGCRPGRWRSSSLSSSPMWPCR